MVPSSPGAASTIPVWSVTEISSGESPSTLEATMCTIDLTCWLLILAPVLVSMSTPAVVFSSSVTNTDLAGEAMWTTAVSMPLMASMVRPSSPSRARWNCVCCWNSEVVRPDWSSAA